MTTRRLRTTMVGSSLLLMAAANARNTHQQPTDAVLLMSTAPLFQNASATEPAHDSTSAAKPDAAPMVSNTTKAPQAPLNATAAKFVEAYIKKNGEGLQKVEERSAAVFKIMEPILAKYDLPVELKYLAVVESDLKRTAVSRVGAAGPWQLMPATARELGLHVSRKYDERKMYGKSTTAAALYLRDLYKAYGDWLLVIAAYNAGPGVVNKAIQRSGSRNFWKLQYLLPAETRGHVKRFIGTHYFFEDKGGETTLTKAEMQTYAKALEQFTAVTPALDETTTLVATFAPAAAVPQKMVSAPMTESILVK